MKISPAEAGRKSQERRVVVRAAVDTVKGRKDGFVRIPRSFLTDIAPLLTEGELKAALAVYVETVGRSREANSVTLGRLQTLTGMPRRSVTRCIGDLDKAGVITRGRDLTAPIRRKQATIYAPTIFPDYEKPNRDTSDPMKAPHRDARDPMHRDTPDPIIGTPETPSLESLEKVEKSSSVPEQAGTSEADRTMIAFVSENLKTFFADRGYRVPSGRMPAPELTSVLRGASAEQDDFVAFLIEYGERIEDPPATWKHVVASLKNWLTEDETKASLATRNQVRMARHRREEQIKQLQEIRTTEVPIPDAKKLLEGGIMDDPPEITPEGYCRHLMPASKPYISEGLLADIEDAGIKRISPQALLKRSKVWKPCPSCGGEGTIYEDPEKKFTSAVDWCVCRAAQRIRLREPDHVDRRNVEQNEWRELDRRIMHGYKPSPERKGPQHVGSMMAATLAAGELW